MHTSFTIAGIVLGALAGFKTGIGKWVLLGLLGVAVELIVGISVIHIARISAPPWIAGIGGLFLGNAFGSIAHAFAKI